MGDLEAQSTKAQMAQPWSYQLFAVLMILVLMMCATLTVFVAIKSSQNAQRISDLQNFYMDDIEEEGEDVVFTKHTVRNARSAVNGFVEVCNSTFFPSLNVTPSAHLVGSNDLDPQENDNNNDGSGSRYIRCGWSCQNHGHVHGGMKAEDGKIIVPVEGIYMVYSQVKIYYDGNDHETIHYGHYTLLSDPAGTTSLKILHSVNTAGTKKTYSAHHQSGLFYIPKGGKVFVDLWSRSKLKSLANNIKYDPESTYFGAYYVSGCNKDGCAELNNYYSRQVSGDLVNWKCGEVSGAHVVGGMKTDHGELVVPVSGVYYIYLQLRLKVHVDSHASNKVLAHKIKIRRSNNSPFNPVTEKYDSLYKNQNDYETTGYHGGLFYLNRGDAIVVNIQNPCYPTWAQDQECKLSVIRSTRANFYGAFLVTPLNASS